MIDPWMHIPANPEAVTPSWLTSALRSTRTLRHAVVKSFETHRIGVEAGYSGQIARFRLAYSDPPEGEPPEDAPASLVGKFVSFDPKAQTFSQNSSQREVRFFSELATEPGLPAPRCYYAAMNSETGASILLLEDLGHFREADLNAGCGSDDVELVIRQLASMHSKWWQSPQLRALEWLPSIAAFANEPMKQWWASYPRTVASLLPDDRPPEAFFEIGRRFSVDTRRVFAPLAMPPFTCLHRDVHAANILFGQRDGDRPLVLIDCPLVAWGRGVSDVTYFMISSVTPAQRRRSEQRLLELYHRLLIENGVKGYSLDQCWSDYRRAVFGKLLVTVAGTVLYDNSSAHRREWRRVDLERLTAFLEDHAVAEFL